MTSTLGQAAPVAVPPRRPAAPRARAPRRRRRHVLLAVTVVAALAATLVVVTSRTGSPRRAWTFAVPTAYSVTYDVTADGTQPSTERLWVRRPFDAVDITYSGTSTSAKPSLLVVYRLGVQVLKAADAEAGLLHIPAGAAPQDVRADLVVAAALRANRAKLVGQARVLGRDCQLVRTAVPLRAGALPALTRSRYVDTCIDHDGIVLRETQVVGGRAVSTRSAVDVTTGAGAVGGAQFDLSGTPTPFNSGGGAFTPLTLTSRPPGGSWALAQPPAGFQHLGRFAVVPPQPQLFANGGGGFGTMGLPGGLVTEMDDVFVRGGDFLVLQQGSTLNGAAFSPPAGGMTVDLGPLGPGQLLVAGSAMTAVAEPGNHKGFVRLSGTLPVATLLRLMRGLVKEPGGTLTRLYPDASAGAGG